VLGFKRPLISKNENGHRSLEVTEIPAYANALGADLYKIVDIIAENDSTCQWDE